MKNIKEDNSKKQWTIYVDGACIGNPGPGGWGVFATHNGQEHELQGGARDTTNNRMELWAAIEALEWLEEPSEVVVYTDSQYVQLGITERIHKWRANGWRTSDKKPVKNVYLWLRLEEAAQRHRVEWIWIRGHDGIPGNERAHELAQEAAERAETGKRHREGVTALALG